MECKYLYLLADRSFREVTGVTGVALTRNSIVVHIYVQANSLYSEVIGIPLNRISAARMHIHV